MVHAASRTWDSAVVSVLVTLMVSAVLTAPVAQNNIEGIKAALKSQLKDQEQALESLATLTNKAGTNGLEVSKLKSMSYSNVNGAENKFQQQEEKVADPVSDKLISDVAETVEQNQASAEEVPQTSFQASVDIPAAGIHKQVSSDDDIQQQQEQQLPMEEERDTIAFTPEVVADYLRGEGKMEEFQELMAQLVANAEVTPAEAEQYEKSVMDAYYSQPQTPNFDVNMPVMDALYPQSFGEDTQPIFPLYNAMPYQDKNEMYPIGYDDEAPLVPGAGPVMPQQGEPAMDDYPVSLDDMISYLLNEWLTRAIVTGDPEAGEILGNIVEYVSRDNNPNDEEQVKAILGDIIAETLLEDLSPRTEPQPIPDFEIFRDAARQNVPVFPLQGQPEPELMQQQQQPEQEADINEDNNNTSDNIEEELKEETEQMPMEPSEQKEVLESQLKM